MALPTTAVELRPECQFGEHSMCKIEEVRTPTARILVFPAKRCDCSCHQKGGKR